MAHFRNINRGLIGILRASIKGVIALGRIGGQCDVIQREPRGYGIWRWIRRVHERRVRVAIRRVSITVRRIVVTIRGIIVITTVILASIKFGDYIVGHKVYEVASGISHVGCISDRKDCGISNSAYNK